MPPVDLPNPPNIIVPNPSPPDLTAPLVSYGSQPSKTILLQVDYESPPPKLEQTGLTEKQSKSSDFLQFRQLFKFDSADFSNHDILDPIDIHQIKRVLC